MSGEGPPGEPPGRVDREGIYIDRELADAVAIEEELDSSVVGVYRFPEPRRRRIAGWVYLATAVVAVITVDFGWVVASFLGALATWHFLSAWPLAVDEHRALTRAAASVDFPIGHASAAIRFHGWRSRPRWSVILYSATEPPDRRALVVVDGIDGRVAEPPYVEQIEPALSP